MKQYQRLFLLLVLALVATAGTSIHSSRASSPQNKYRLVVTVTSADRNEPVEGASVTVRYVYDPAFESIRLETQTTDQDGRVWIIPAALGGLLKVEPKAGSRFDIEVTHPDFTDAYRPVVIRSDTRPGDIRVPVSMKRKSGSKVVAVQVVAAGDRAPVYDATVKLKGSISPTLFSGVTNSSGRALISVTEGGDYMVTVTHTGYETVTKSVSVKMYDDQREYNLSLEMKPRNEARRGLRVTVRGKDKEGKTVPVRYAQVTLPDGQTKTTDYEGAVQFSHKLPPGEEAKVEVEATYYKPGSATFIVGVRRVEGDTVSINLEREDEGIDCGVGKTWHGVESGHSMTWKRIGDSNQFIVEGKINGQKFTAKQDIFIAGDKVTITRFQASDGNTCNFKGTITNGTASGTYECTKYKPSSGWSATISCN